MLLSAADKYGIGEEIVGGEMEGSGIWYARRETNVPIMIIKGICDWGANKNGYYLREIQADLDWYGEIYDDMGMHNRVFIDNDPPSVVVDRIVSEYGLSVKKLEVKNSVRGAYGRNNMKLTFLIYP